MHPNGGPKRAPNVHPNGGPKRASGGRGAVAEPLVGPSGVKATTRMGIFSHTMAVPGDTIAVMLIPVAHVGSSSTSCLSTPPLPPPPLSDHSSASIKCLYPLPLPVAFTHSLYVLSLPAASTSNLLQSLYRISTKEVRRPRGDGEAKEPLHKSLPNLYLDFGCVAEMEKQKKSGLASSGCLRGASR